MRAHACRRPMALMCSRMAVTNFGYLKDMLLVRKSIKCFARRVCVVRLVGPAGVRRGRLLQARRATPERDERHQGDAQCHPRDDSSLTCACASNCS